MKNFLFVILLLCKINIILANPENGVVVAGEASWQQQGDRLEILQQTDRAIIDWQSFDITANEHTNFIQPSHDAIALNRIYSSEASKIEGNLTANGKIILINQNGIVFGNSAIVDVNSLLATTANIDNKDFLTNSEPGNILRFNQPGESTAQIINEGNIKSEHGLIGLVAPKVINSGVILAKTGNIQLQSGDLFTIDLYGDGLLELAVTTALPDQLVSNSGEIITEHGKILLTAAAGVEIVNSLIMHTGGILKASKSGVGGGEIIITAEGSNAVKGNVLEQKGKRSGYSNVFIRAPIDVSGIEPGNSGGRVEITGDQIEFLDGTMINASGANGLAATTNATNRAIKRIGSAGGEVLIGGDYLGTGTTPTAQNLYVGAGVIILNDAIFAGDAGRTILWSDGATSFYGAILSRALGGKPINLENGHASSGGNLGDGGFVETSGKQYLDPYGSVNLTASNGEVGIYLLDPSTINIIGEFDPKFVSTDGSINLSQNLKMWVDFSDQSKMQLVYRTVRQLGADAPVIANGTNGSNTLTVDRSTHLLVNARIKLGDSSLENVTTTETPDDQLSNGTNIYTITGISGTTLTVTPKLKQNYTNTSLRLGYINKSEDKSGNNNHASLINDSQGPILLVQGINNLNVANYTRGEEQMFVMNEFTQKPDFIEDPRHLTYVIAFNTTDGISTGSHQLFSLTSPAYPNLPPSFEHAFVLRPRVTNYKGWFYYKMDPNTGGITLTVPRGSNNANNVSLLNNYPHTLSVSGDYFNNKLGVYIDGNLTTTSLENNFNANITTNFPSNNMITYNVLGGFPNVTNAAKLRGNIYEVMAYNIPLSAEVLSLIAQYQAKKWGITLVPPVMSYSTGVNGSTNLTAGSLFDLSKTSNVNIVADQVNLDLQNNTLNLSSGKSLSITARTGLTVSSPGIINTATGGNISIQLSAGSMDLQNLNLSSNGGAINVATTSGSIILGNMSGSTVTATAGGTNSNITVPSGVTVVSTNPTTPVSLTATGEVINNSSSGGTINNSLKGNLNILLNGSGLVITYGDPIPTFSNITFTLTGYLVPDSYVADLVTGQPVITTNYVQGNAVGNYNLNISKGTIVSNLNYGISDGVVNDFLQVVARRLTIIASPKTKVYGTLDPILTYNYTADDLVNTDNVSSVLTGSLTRQTGENIGSYLISQGTLQTNNNYFIDYSSANLTITKKTLNLSAVNVTKVYGATDPTLTYNYVAADLVNGDQPTIITGALGRSSGEEVGTYAITKNTLAAGDNYDINFSSANFTITKKTLNISAVNTTKAYGDPDPNILYNYVATDLGNGDNSTVITGNLSRVAGEALGNYSINQNTLTAGNNYQINYTPATFTIAKRPLNVTVATVTKVYGDIDPELTYTVTNLLNNDTADVVLELSRTPGETAGEYPITHNDFTITNNNYTLNYTPGKLVVLPKDLNVIAVSVSKTYGSSDPSLSYDISGLINNDQPNIVNGDLTRIPGENVGNYPILLGQVHVSNANYRINYLASNFTIVPKPLRINAVNFTKVYGSTDPNFTYTYEDVDFTNGDTSNLINGNLTRTTGENVGDYQILQHNINAGNNYTITYTGAKMTILQKPLRIIATEKTKVYGSNDPILTYDYISSDLVNGDQSNIISGNLSRNSGEEVGVYPITSNITAGNNYMISYSGANLNITPKSMNISLVGNVTKEYDGNRSLNVDTANYSLNGILSNDNVTIDLTNASGSYNDAALGEGKSLIINGLAITGTHVHNYSLANPTITAINGSIIPKLLNIVLSRNTKTYDGSNVLTLAYSDYLPLTGIVGTEQVLLSKTNRGTFDTSNVGANKPLALVGVRLFGLDAGKYRLNYVEGNTNTVVISGSIAPKPLTVYLLGNVNKIYDGTNIAPLNSSNYSNLFGVIGNDKVTLVSSGYRYL